MIDANILFMFISNFHGWVQFATTEGTSNRQVLSNNANSSVQSFGVSGLCS